MRGGRNLVWLHEIPALQVVRQRAFSDDSNVTVMQCLVTSEHGPIQKLHPSTQSSGASLISFNSLSFESYGRVEAQGLNAPVGTRAGRACSPPAPTATTPSPWTTTCRRASR